MWLWLDASSQQKTDKSHIKYLKCFFFSFRRWNSSHNIFFSPLVPQLLIVILPLRGGVTLSCLYKHAFMIKRLCKGYPVPHNYFVNTVFTCMPNHLIYSNFLTYPISWIYVHKTSLHRPLISVTNKSMGCWSK